MQYAILIYMEIKIECQGATTVNIDELNELHHFKTMTDDHYAHARNSITELGFSFPFFVWIDANGTKWAVDGNSRLKVLKRMRDEGYVIPDLPADIINAKDKTEAKKKLIAAESRYADPSEGEFAAFLSEDNIEIEDVEAFMDIPDIDSGHWDIPDEAKEKKQKEPEIVLCPHCNQSFTLQPK